MLTSSSSSSSSQVDADLFPLIIGKGRQTQRQIEKDSGALLTIPPKTAKGGKIGNVVVIV